MICLLACSISRVIYGACIRTRSCRSNDERWLKVAIDDQVGQGVIFAYFVLLSIYLPREQLVEVDLLAGRGFGAHLLNIELLLEIIGEAHDHV